ncbi:DUF4292 domain-containing protein [Flavicella sediminum]|uniref:DUF4292 domain-containing protein n=1 Tax=Flavicella sediminum TaxID=2585141 RepID=UPI00140830DC|nr:DUF4292 domain-containing protein [Flavicella sediminum]
MRTKIFYILSAFILFSCGANRNLKDRANVVEESSKRVIKNHYKNTFDQETLSADLKINFKKGGSSKSISMSLKLQKDETILLNGSFFGFSILKALITPDRVSYYIKPTKTYYDGDFSSLSKLLGTDVNYEMVQNLLLGDAIVKLNATDYDSTLDQQAHLLTPKQPNELAKIFFWVHPLNYKIEKQEVISNEKNGFLTINYEDFQNINGTSIPGAISIQAKNDKNNASIHLDYKSIELNKKLSFPYKIPSGYKRIEK